MSNTIIRASFETRLKNWADAQTPKVPVAFESVNFTKPADGTPFVECFLVPNVTMNPTIDGHRTRRYGVFQVNCWAQQGKGMKSVETLAEAIVSLFPLIPKVGAVSVEETPTVKPRIPDGSGWVIVPVTIKYRFEEIS